MNLTSLFINLSATTKKKKKGHISFRQFNNIVKYLKSRQLQRKQNLKQKLLQNDTKRDGNYGIEEEFGTGPASKTTKFTI